MANNALDLNSAPKSTILRGISQTRWVKYLFLSFVQALFKESGTYTWNADRQKTKIIIQDKYTNNAENPELRPVVVFNKGTYQIEKTHMGMSDAANIMPETVRPQTEALSFNSSFSCISTAMYDSEYIADLIATNLWAERKQFLSKGVLGIRSIAVGDTSPMDADQGTSNIVLYITPIYINFELTMTVENKYSSQADFINKWETTIV